MKKLTQLGNKHETRLESTSVRPSAVRHPGTSTTAKSQYTALAPSAVLNVCRYPFSISTEMLAPELQTGQRFAGRTLFDREITQHNSLTPLIFIHFYRAYVLSFHKIKRAWLLSCTNWVTWRATISPNPSAASFSSSSLIKPARIEFKGQLILWDRLRARSDEVIVSS